MNRDTQKRPAVSHVGTARNAPIGDPGPSSQASQQRRVTAAPASVSVTISNKYIDSRLKQFCLR
jgi:hypothetical protein